MFLETPSHLDRRPQTVTDAKLQFAATSARGGEEIAGWDSTASPALAKELAQIFPEPPALIKHYEGVTTNEVRDRLTQERNYREVLKEKAQDKWFAVLLSTKAEERYAIKGRFATWKGLIDFLVDQGALVEVWAYPEGATGVPRRIPATELAVLKKERWEQPTFVTVTFPDQTSTGVETYRVEFGSQAASTALLAIQAYQRHREIQMVAREILGARDAQGKFSAVRQWETLADAVDEGRLSLAEMPRRPGGAGDLFVAFEYQVDGFNNFAGAVRVYRESEIEKRIRSEAGNQNTQILRLKSAGADGFREAAGYRTQWTSDELELVPYPIPGRDYVELRIRDPREPDVRRWNVLEFGEPELLKESALAKFSLINAYLEKRRKELAIKKSNFDLVAEPVFAGLNIAGGLAGFGFPAGEGARLFYDLTVGIKFIPQVPTVAEMRLLFELLAARANHAELKTKPLDLLDEADLKELRQSVQRLTPAQMQEFLEAMNDDDLKGMLSLARMQHIDAKVSTFLDILSDASHVTAMSRSTVLRGIFSSPYFSVTGEISLKNLIAAAVGAQAAVTGNGLSLKQLSEGKGPATAWLQYLNLTVDIRAVMNTFSRLAHASLADKELKQPFPYAPRMTDLAAYEIRIFGFPLLMFYKRGLLKDDYRAYTNDYAYGLLGTRIVEHFQTREQMDEEIRAGRMFPLGYVRVPDGSRGWKETTLAVFAYRIPAGKHRGKTAMVLYGLKAYAEHSQFVEREYDRFKAFESALEQGAVIEQLVNAEDRRQIPAVEFEPRMHVGADSGGTTYPVLLGELLELRRHQQREGWGLPDSPMETAAAARVREELATKGVWVADGAGDPLLEVDNKYFSRFRCRKQLKGKWRVFEFTSIPSLAEVERELTKAEERQRIEQLRREAVSPRGKGILLINEAIQADGGYEIGPLCRDRSNQVFGAGVRTGAQAIKGMLDQISGLPVADRVRLAMNQFSATVLDLDVTGDGVRKVFVTFEFPPDYELEWTNPLTGEEEVHAFNKGRLTRTVTDRRVIDFLYHDGIEIQSKTYENRGNWRQPKRGVLLEGTTTLEAWFRNPNQPVADPSLPVLRKLAVNYVTGQMTSDTFGLHPDAVTSVDDLHITEARFDDHGRFVSATTHLNGLSDGDFQRSRMEKLLNPTIGRVRFQFTAQDDTPQTVEAGGARTPRLQRPVERFDVNKGVSKVLTFDHANFGRLSAEAYTDRLDPERTFGVRVDYEYRDDFHFGLVPWRTVKRDSGSGAQLSVVATTKFDPVERRLTGTEVDYTGKSSLKTWDYRWENRVEDESDLRRTTFAYNIEETSVAGRTVSKEADEESSRFHGEFDPATGMWRIHRDVWHRPGVLARRETDLRSAFGKMAATRLGEEFENRPVYDAEGFEVAREVRHFNPSTGRFDLLIRREDDYRWQQGGRDARVQTFVDGQPYDLYRTIGDNEGRITTDGIKELPGLDLRTSITYDGATERRQQVEVLQNKQSRRVSHFLPATRQPDGTYVILEVAAPFWGLASTNSYQVDDLAGRPFATVFENGDTLQVIEWFPGTSIPRISQMQDERGRLKQRVERTLREGEEDGLRYDVERRYRVGSWGETGLAEEKAVVQGSDVALFSLLAGEKVYFDLRKPYEAPRYKRDSGNRGGFPVTLDGVQRSHVTAVVKSGFVEAPDSARPERVQVLDCVDLHGLFFHKVTQRSIDFVGNVLREEVSSIPNPGAAHYTDFLLFDAAQHAVPTVTFRYYYDAGFRLDLPDPESGGRMLVFTNNPGVFEGKGIPVNGGRWREMLTRIEGVKGGSSDTPGQDPRSNHLFRVVHRPHERSRNPYLPAQTNVWTSWVVDELGPDGATLFVSELTYDAAGNLSVNRATKTTSSGANGARISYQILRPPRDLLRNLPPGAVGRKTTLDTLGQSDFSGSDFIYLYVADMANPDLLITDRAGREVRVGKTRAAGEAVAFWRIDSANVRWLPDSETPRQGTALSAPASLLNAQGVVAVSVHDLAQAGLDIRRLTGVRIQVPEKGATLPQVSPVLRLERGTRFVADATTEALSYASLDHFNGLGILLKTREKRTESERIEGLNVDSVVAFNGHPVAYGRTRAGRETYPIAVMMDDSDPEAPRPLYTLSPDNGRFLEYFKTATAGDLYTYTVAGGFEVPQLEVRRANVLDDEIHGGLLAYGTRNPVTIPLAKGHNPLSRALANEHNRIAANAFKLAGDHFLALRRDRDAARVLGRFNQSAFRSSLDSAREIDSLPMLAQVLLPTTILPWAESSREPGDDLTDTPVLRRSVQGKVRQAGLYGLRRYPNTGLTPTAPATVAEPFVETVPEADLILLEIGIGEFEMARGLLDFFGQQSATGRHKLHSSYDARSGAPQAYDPLGRRPLHSLQTAEAQIAIAEAAFKFGFATGDATAFALGENLLSLVLTEFRPSGEAPRGIADLPARETNQLYSVTFWPTPATYAVKCNARAYLVLKQLERNEPIARPRISDGNWNLFLQAGRDLEDWLRKYVLTPAEQTGVVSKGRFQLQNIDDKTTALAAERWTSAEDWLCFLEAADQMGIPRETTRPWLEHLARLHGVRVRGFWGLDWSTALFRPDAISTRLTAKFLRVARQLGHGEAATFASRNLLSLRTNGVWPALVTEADQTQPLATGQGSWIYADQDPSAAGFSPAVFKELLPDRTPVAASGSPPPRDPERTRSGNGRTDYTVFLLITGAFYFSILAVAIFWWRFRAARHQWRAGRDRAPDEARLVTDSVLQLAEERWAKRVLGVCTPESAERTRFSNAPVEANFHMQLRAIHKLVVEWRRRENGWGENDPRLVEDAGDEWLNGLDEFCSMVGIYMRWVIKAGAKDGFRKEDVLSENEDSNHIWSRLVMYFSEYHWGLLTLLNRFDSGGTDHRRRDLNAQVVLLLNAMGMRQRTSAFDARRRFNFPADPTAMDLLIIQQPGMTLGTVVKEMAVRLEIPGRHLVQFIKKYKAFKRQENPYPIHPYLIEAAKLLPHFFLMSFGALVYYNYHPVGDRPMVPYLWEEIITRRMFDVDFQLCGLLLVAALVLSVAARTVRVYRWETTMISRSRPEFPLDKTLTGLFTSVSLVLPLIRPGWKWNPVWYDRAAWALRAVGFFWLGTLLLKVETAGFTTFLLVKGLLAVLAFAESAAIVVPLAMTWLSKILQDQAGGPRPASRIIQSLNRLNLTATRPASLLWQSLRYHFRPSVLSGDFPGLLQAVVIYFVLAAAFFFAGGILCQEMFPLWFTEQYRVAADWKLVAGAFIFWITMYLLRFGLFVFVTGVASWLAAFPVKGIVGLLGLLYVGFVSISPLIGLPLDGARLNHLAWPFALAALGLMLWEERVTGWLRRACSAPASLQQKEQDYQAKLEQIKATRSATLGVVYMSGDDLSSQKLTPELLMTRWELLRDKFASEGLRLISGMVNQPDAGTLLKWFSKLHEAEKKGDVTLWHPSQLCVPGGPWRYPAESGLNVVAESAEECEQLLSAWHLRRWLATMMSTAGHSQDTGVNLVDIALRLDREGLGANTVFYLIQNKYDNGDHNRPSQSRYDLGELGQRNKLARLLGEVAPGARAYSIQNWTPFGFKAGGLTGTDLIHEESLNLGTLVLLDRNATVHDLDALMKDVGRALTDPNVVIVIPGRSTTNTGTAVGQGSQMVEEGHRSFLKGLMTLLGGNASESLGTGWGNILGVLYGPVQRALVSTGTSAMPLTSRMRRGASFALKLEGLIGFGPHAVGISEDTWAVSQATHNAIALGLRPRFLLSCALWHKIRETWTHSEWLSSFPRWSGGYLQMMQDPIMQQINEFGPLSVFAKEVRANSGRFYLTALFTLLNIMLMPLAIILDVTPFVEILIVLWNFGFVMNQILTVHGLQTYLESSGFYRMPAILGAAVGAVLPVAVTALRPLAPALVVLGFLTGGFAVGLGRWWSTRLRDVILFGPQLVLHALGQFVRQSLEFAVSGASPKDAGGVNMAYRCAAGPREDRPGEGFASVLNLRTVVWGVGFLSFVLNILALSGLDLLNVLMLLPSLLFSVSALVGPFVMAPAVGRHTGLRVIMAKGLGWLGAMVFYIGVSSLIARGGPSEWAGVILFFCVAAYLLYRAGRYVGFRRKVDGVSRKLSGLIAVVVEDASAAHRLTRQILERTADDPSRVRMLLDQHRIPPPDQAAILGLVDKQLGPLLRAPAMESQKYGLSGSRFRSEFGRSCVLALLILFWFFLVPVPGLFVFSAGAHRVATHLGTILAIVSSGVGLALAGSCLGRIIQWIDRGKPEQAGLAWRVANAFQAFQSMLRAPGMLDDQKKSSAFALFTDVQTYVDQRSYAYARRSIGLIEKILEGGSR